MHICSRTFDLICDTNVTYLSELSSNHHQFGPSSTTSSATRNEFEFSERAENMMPVNLPGGVFYSILFVSFIFNFHFFFVQFMYNELYTYLKIKSESLLVD